MVSRTIDANELMLEIQACNWDSEQDKDRAGDLVLGMSTITPQDVAPMRHGIWLKLSDGSPYCSICGAVERDTYDAVTEECKYCYSCGSRMDGKDDKHEI